MANWTHLERTYCLWPGCRNRATRIVWGNDGGEEGTFCTPHSNVMIAHLNRGEQAVFDFEHNNITWES